MMRFRSALVVGMLVAAFAGWSEGAEPVVKLVAPKTPGLHQPVVQSTPQNVQPSRPSEQPDKTSTPQTSAPQVSTLTTGRESGRSAAPFVPRFQQLAPIVDLKPDPPQRTDNQMRQVPALPQLAPVPAISGGRTNASEDQLPPVIDAHEYRLQQQAQGSAPLASELARMRHGSEIRALKQSVVVPPPPTQSRNQGPATRVSQRGHEHESPTPASRSVLADLSANVNSSVNQSRAASRPAVPALSLAVTARQETSPSDLPPVEGDRLGFPKFERRFAPVKQLSTNILPPEGKLPKDLARANFQRAGEVFQPIGASRDWVLRNYAWVAPGTYHWPLFFEDENVERYGYHVGCLQPVVSAAHFFGRLPVLPYMHGVWPCHECIYTLGHYRPGDCVPYRCSRLPWSLRGALFEAGAVTGAVALIP